MSKKTDLRVIRTRKAIKDAFMELIRIKEYNKITIQDIADRAIINRNTFYLHYIDKDDLLDKLSEECFNKLDAAMNSNENIKSINDLSYDAFLELNKCLFMTIEEDIEFYKVILSDGSIPYLLIKLTNVIKDHIANGLHGTKRSFYVEYMVAGLIGIIRYWIKNRDNYTIDDVTKLLVDIYSKDMIDLLRD